MKFISILLTILTFTACNNSQANTIISNEIPQCNALSMESDVVLGYQDGYSYDVITENNIQTVNEYFDLNVAVDDIVYGYCGGE